jgi:2-methylcitrate dehydratase PrpD
MNIEQRFADFVCTLQAGDVPPDAQRIVGLVLLAATGAAVAGAAEDGIEPLRALLRERGGVAQATSFVYGDKLPAASAAQLNGTMCRALDYCDAMAPGIHIGSSLIPAALAAAEAAGGCTGAEFLAALAAGAEISSRLNLSEAMYDGFDPTGIAVVFAPTAAAARILKLTPQQTLHALALAFNRCGGSFQSNIDGSLAVRAIQGWVAETGMVCAQMAQRGFTGPQHFLSGIYGYGYLYGRGELDVHALADGLGTDWRLLRMMFKKYPSCGATQGMTELVLQLLAELDLRPEQVRALRVVLPPYAFKLVGQPWHIGANPRVDAQFSAQYCVANAIVRRGSALPHFRVDAVHDAAVGRLIERVRVESDPALNARGHTAVDVLLDTDDGRTHARSLDVAPGFPDDPLSDAQQRARFDDCMAYAPRPLTAQQQAGFLQAVGQLGELTDARRLLSLLVAAPKGTHG